MVQEDKNPEVEENIDEEVERSVDAGDGVTVNVLKNGAINLIAPEDMPEEEVQKRANEVQEAIATANKLKKVRMEQNKKGEELTEQEKRLAAKEKELDELLNRHKVSEPKPKTNSRFDDPTKEMLKRASEISGEEVTSLKQFNELAADYPEDFDDLVLARDDARAIARARKIADESATLSEKRKREMDVDEAVVKAGARIDIVKAFAKANDMAYSDKALKFYLLEHPQNNIAEQLNGIEALKSDKVTIIRSGTKTPKGSTPKDDIINRQLKVMKSTAR